MTNFYLSFILSLLLFPLTASAEPKIKIGVIAPLSGPAAELGTQIKNGIEVAKKDLKSNVEFIYEDGACNATAALTAARKLTNMNNVPVVIGPLCSPPFLSVAPLLRPSSVLRGAGTIRIALSW